MFYNPLLDKRTFPFANGTYYHETVGVPLDCEARLDSTLEAKKHRLD